MARIKKKNKTSSVNSAQEERNLSCHLSPVTCHHGIRDAAYMARIKQQQNINRLSSKAQFFTVDALIALMIIIVTVITISPMIRQSQPEATLSSDILLSLGSISIGDFDNTYAQQLIAEGKISDPSKSVLEQIGEFYVTNTTIAKRLAEETLSSVSPTENIGIWYGTTLLASQNITPFETAENIFTDRQTISGIGGNDSVTGFSTRASLSSSSRTAYKYFGGYVGEGNITVEIDYQGGIHSATIEAVINNDFEIIVNGNSLGVLTGSPDESTPISYNLSTAHFTSGTNTIQIKGESLHIAGGFMKITYDSNVTYAQPVRYYFPGIQGIINLYDAFYIPGNLTGLSISLHFNNSIETFLTLGKTQIFSASSDGTSTISIPNSTLASLLNYSDLNQQTIPIRFGMEDMHYHTNDSNEIDVFSITSVSGQMQGGASIALLKEGNYEFIRIVLTEKESNRIGLVGYENEAKDEDFHPLSTNASTLNDTVTGWKAGSSTCTCCGINRAVAALVNNSNSSKIRSIVVMSAGAGNTKCLEQNTGDPETDAIKAVCDAYNDYGIQAYTIGFGDSANVATLTEMAACADGSFYSAVDDLESVYTEIAEEIIETAYYEQTVEVSGDFFSQLFQDSYIEFEYTEEPLTTGLMATIEQPFTDSENASFSLPLNSTIIEANVISYSGPKWTAYLELNGNPIYNLSEYQADFLKLGDPYSVNIPQSLVLQNNNLTLKTGLGSENLTEGSIHNKIIYTISKDLASYTSVSATADGCNWTIQFNTYNLTLPIPADYNGTENCEYSASSYCDIYPDCAGATDSSQIAAYNLLKLLDFDADGILDVDLSASDMQITTSNLGGVPFLFSTEVQIRKWY